LREGRLLRRYKRFLADVEFADTGERVTVHCPNTGAMTGCAEPGVRVWLSHSDNPRRRYAWTWELVEPSAGTLVGIHTGRSNAIVAEALQAGRLVELEGYEILRREAPYPASRSRADFLLGDGERRCWMEVKNVTAAVADRRAVFPDAVSVRAAGHMRMLASRCRAGDAAALVFCVQREDVDRVSPASEIDPAYAEALTEAIAAGVLVLALGTRVTTESIIPERRLDFDAAG
jgi:sugar fermentation stimulation protein A